MSVLIRKGCEKCSTSTFLFTKNKVSNILKPKMRNMNTSEYSPTKKIGASAVLLMAVPITGFGLGTWQIKRLQWKNKIVAELKAKTTQPAQNLPEDLNELENLEFHRIKVRGTFDHSKEMYIGPKGMLSKDGSASQSSIISTGKIGFLIVTPFKLEDRDLTILVNRGWVHKTKKNPAVRLDGQVEGVVSIEGIVRHQENRPPFTPKNTRPDVSMIHRDLHTLSVMGRTAPIYIDAVEGVPNGPIAGQTRVNIRNEHLSYIITWYSLSFITAYMWFHRFVKPHPFL